MQGNVLGQADGRSSNLNIFTQLKEPTKKDGIWIKTEETEIDGVLYTQLPNTPFNFRISNTTTIGTDIYIYGIESKDSKSRGYKYDTLTNVCTQLPDVPEGISWIVDDVTAIDKIIYIFGFAGNTSNTDYIAYKYDITTNTYTKLANIPYFFLSR